MQKIKLTAGQKKDLLLTVRCAIEEKLFGKSAQEPPALSDQVFSQAYGLFVTLTAGGELRGCIGYVEGIKPVREAVRDMAVQSAFNDPRFYPLNKEEYPKISVEISILYPLEEVTDFSAIQPGRDGLVMEKGYHRGLLLPQVAAEYGWDRETFMNQTCRKAGLENYAWENGAKVYKFEAEVFDEEEPGMK